MTSLAVDLERLRNVFVELNDCLYELNDVNRGLLRDRHLAIAVTEIETGALWLHNYITRLADADA